MSIASCDHGVLSASYHKFFSRVDIFFWCFAGIALLRSNDTSAVIIDPCFELGPLIIPASETSPAMNVTFEDGDEEGTESAYMHVFDIEPPEAIEPEDYTTIAIGDCE